MIYPSVRFVFDRKKRGSASRCASVDIEVYYQRKRKYISTGVRVLPREWSAKDCVVKRPDAFILNRLLEEKISVIRDGIQEVFKRGEEFSLSMVGAEQLHSAAKGSFIDYVRVRNAERSDIRDSTRRTQGKLVEILKKFKRIQSFSDLTGANIRSFDVWLHKRYDKQTTVHSYHKFLKTYARMAMREGLISEDPYRGIRIDVGKPAMRKFLSKEELDAIKGIEVEDLGIMRARDVFLFQCYTGIAYSDLARIDFASLRRDDGRYVLREQRQKTDVPFCVVLLPPALEILERYNFKLPITSNQKYNNTLKWVAAHARLKMKLTSHCGRHTFATWCLNQGVPLERLKVMLGHADFRTTENYAKMLNKSVEDEFDRLEKLCFD